MSTVALPSKAAQSPDRRSPGPNPTTAGRPTSPRPRSRQRGGRAGISARDGTWFSLRKPRNSKPASTAAWTTCRSCADGAARLRGCGSFPHGPVQVPPSVSLVASESSAPRRTRPPTRRPRVNRRFAPPYTARPQPLVYTPAGAVPASFVPAIARRRLGAARPGRDLGFFQLGRRSRAAVFLFSRLPRAFGPPRASTPIPTST